MRGRGRLTEDSIRTIIEYLQEGAYTKEPYPRYNSEWATSSHRETMAVSYTVPFMTPVQDLKTLALVHRHFLDPVRSALFRMPVFENRKRPEWDSKPINYNETGPVPPPLPAPAPPAPTNPLAPQTAPQTTAVQRHDDRSAAWHQRWTRQYTHFFAESETRDTAPLVMLRAFVASLELNPALGEFVLHLPRLGRITAQLTNSSVSPTLLSKSVLSLLEKSTNLLTLDMPTVELRYQENLIRAVTGMSALRSLTLGSGCIGTKDGTSMFHEGDLRRIAISCAELEELSIHSSHIGCGSDEGWVEPFRFRELRELHLEYATSLSDKHLGAITAMSTKLSILRVVKSAGLDGSLNREISPPPVEGPQEGAEAKVEEAPPPRLTTQGIATVLERRGGTLKVLVIDTSNNPIPTDLSIDTVPSIQSALVHCTVLRELTLIGPGLVLGQSLSHLGSPAPESNSKQSYGMPRYPSPSARSQGLTHLERLTVGLQPAQHPHLLTFLHSLSPASGGVQASPLLALRSIELSAPPATCIGHGADAISKVGALHDVVKNKALVVRFTSPTGENGVCWARRNMEGDFAGHPFAPVPTATGGTAHGWSRGFMRAGRQLNRQGRWGAAGPALLPGNPPALPLPATAPTIHVPTGNVPALAASLRRRLAAQWRAEDDEELERDEDDTNRVGGAMPTRAPAAARVTRDDTALLPAQRGTTSSLTQDNGGRAARTRRPLGASASEPIILLTTTPIASTSALASTRESTSAREDSSEDVQTRAQPIEEDPQEAEDDVDMTYGEMMWDDEAGAFV
jgi:hypothetical protein